MLLFTIAKVEQPKCPSRDAWVNKMWYVIQWNIIQPFKKEIMIYATTHRNLGHYAK